MTVHHSMLPARLLLLVNLLPQRRPLVLQVLTAAAVAAAAATTAGCNFERLWPLLLLLLLSRSSFKTRSPCAPAAAAVTSEGPPAVPTASGLIARVAWVLLHKGPLALPQHRQCTPVPALQALLLQPRQPRPGPVQGLNLAHQGLA
jgi:hypothetical protein